MVPELLTLSYAGKQSLYERFSQGRSKVSRCQSGSKGSGPVTHPKIGLPDWPLTRICTSPGKCGMTLAIVGTLHRPPASARKWLHGRGISIYRNKQFRTRAESACSTNAAMLPSEAEPAITVFILGFISQYLPQSSDPSSSILFLSIEIDFVSAKYVVPSLSAPQVPGILDCKRCKDGWVFCRATR